MTHIETLLDAYTFMIVLDNLLFYHYPANFPFCYLHLFATFYVLGTVLVAEILKIN